MGDTRNLVGNVRRDCRNARDSSEPKPTRTGSLQCHVISSSLIRQLHNANKQYFGEVNIERIFKERGSLGLWGADDKKIVEIIDYHGWRCLRDSNILSCAALKKTYLVSLSGNDVLHWLLSSPLPSVCFP